MNGCKASTKNNQMTYMIFQRGSSVKIFVILPSKTSLLNVFGRPNNMYGCLSSLKESMSNSVSQGVRIHLSSLETRDYTLLELLCCAVSTW